MVGWLFCFVVLFFFSLNEILCQINGIFLTLLKPMGSQLGGRQLKMGFLLLVYSFLMLSFFYQNPISFPLN